MTAPERDWIVAFVVPNIVPDTVRAVVDAYGKVEAIEVVAVKYEPMIWLPRMLPATDSFCPGCTATRCAAGHAVDRGERQNEGGGGKLLEGPLLKMEPSSGVSPSRSFFTLDPQYGLVVHGVPTYLIRRLHATDDCCLCARGDPRYTPQAVFEEPFHFSHQFRCTTCDKLEVPRRN